MFRYLKFGSIPPLHHVAHYSSSRLLHEYCFTRQGFADPYSILYLHHPPTGEVSREPFTEAAWAQPPMRESGALLRRHFQTPKLAPQGTFITGRTLLAVNGDLHFGFCHPAKVEPVFFANNDGDELFFLQEGRVRLQSLFGLMDLEPGDYLVIPRSCPYRFQFEKSPRFLFVEAKGGIGVPEEYTNRSGQFNMDAPYSERSFQTPEWDPDLFASREPSRIVSKRQETFTLTAYSENHFRMEGWDGYVYPCALNLSRIQPKPDGCICRQRLTSHFQVRVSR